MTEMGCEGILMEQLYPQMKAKVYQKLAHSLESAGVVGPITYAEEQHKNFLPCLAGETIAELGIGKPHRHIYAFGDTGLKGAAPLIALAELRPIMER